MKQKMTLAGARFQLRAQATETVKFERLYREQKDAVEVFYDDNVRTHKLLEQLKDAHAGLTHNYEELQFRLLTVQRVLDRIRQDRDEMAIERDKALSERDSALANVARLDDRNEKQEVILAHCRAQLVEALRMRDLYIDRLRVIRTIASWSAE